MSTSDLSNTDIAVQNRKVCVFNLKKWLPLIENINKNYFIFSLLKLALKRKDVIASIDALIN